MHRFFETQIDSYLHRLTVDVHKPDFVKNQISAS